MSIKYVGRTTDFAGKTLWEILGNLKNFGVGRVVVRSMFERYPEVSYYRIMKVEALHDEDPRKVRATVQKIFRGKKYDKLIQVCSTSYKADYRLIPKAEEEEYCKITQPATLPEKILPTHIECPPLLREFIIQERASRGEDTTQEPMLEIKIRECLQKLARIAKDGEVPNIKVTMGLGTPASPSLYKNIQLHNN